MDRREGLERNRALREGRDAIRKLDSGYVALNIPEQDFYALRKLYPDLTAPDHEVRRKAWQAFVASPFSEPYRVVRSPQQVRRS
jgi:hypothetical protein